MRKLLIFFVLIIASQLAQKVFAQAPFPTIDFVDVNKIKACVLVHGDMWWNPAQQIQICQFPKGAPTSLAFATAVWMSGYDAGNNLHIAAQTYRQNGNDYWPGPLDNADTLTYTTAKDWAKIWKVNRSQIDSFKDLPAHTVTNTAAPILQWPAKGNPYAAGDSGVQLAITNDMAPFVDLNGDGIYNALQGDYPDIKGDQALWWVFSDNGPKHNETNGVPLKIEVHGMAYGYNRGTIMDNVIYYEYDIFNRSQVTYHNFRFGQWICSNLGYAFDDYIGFDSSHRMAITYNGKAFDGTGQVNSYGRMIPMMGLSMVEQPGDAGSSYAPAGSFMPILNNVGSMGNPITPGQYDNYLRSRFKDSTHLKNDFITAGMPTHGYGTSFPDCNYAYPDEPADTGGWSECNSQNAVDAQTFIVSGSDFTLPAGGSQRVVMALLTTNPDSTNACPGPSFTTLKSIADSVWYTYKNPLVNLGLSAVLPENAIHAYPNPAHDKLFIDNMPPDATILVYNMLGQVINVPVVVNGSTAKLNVAALTPGVYIVRHTKDGVGGTQRFVKD